MQTRDLQTACEDLKRALMHSEAHQKSTAEMGDLRKQREVDERNDSTRISERDASVRTYTSERDVSARTAERDSIGRIYDVERDASVRSLERDSTGHPYGSEREPTRPDQAQSVQRRSLGSAGGHQGGSLVARDR